MIPTMHGIHGANLLDKMDASGCVIRSEITRGTEVCNSLVGRFCLRSRGLLSALASSIVRTEEMKGDAFDPE